MKVIRLDESRTLCRCIGCSLITRVKRPDATGLNICQKSIVQDIANCNVSRFETLRIITSIELNHSPHLILEVHFCSSLHTVHVTMPTVPEDTSRTGCEKSGPLPFC